MYDEEVLYPKIGGTSDSPSSRSSSSGCSRLPLSDGHGGVITAGKRRTKREQLLIAIRIISVAVGFTCVLRLLHLSCYIWFGVLFLSHPIVSLPRPSASLLAQKGWDTGLVPLYVLSSSDQRWAGFQPPSGVSAHRIQQTPESMRAYYDAYIDKNSKLGQNRNWRVATGHLLIWDRVSRDPECKHGCIIAEDDAFFVDQVDPRPLMSTFPDDAHVVSLLSWPFFEVKKLPEWRDYFVTHVLGRAREELLYVPYGFSMVAYTMTSHGADTLLEPFRSGHYELDVSIDLYLFDRMGYWHEANTFVARNYKLEHRPGSEGSLRVDNR